MLTLSHFYCLTIFFYIVFCLPTVQSDLQISSEDVEYAAKRIANRYRAVHFKSQPYFRHVTESNMKSLTTNTQRKSGIKQQQQPQPQHDVEDMPQMAAHSEEVLSGGKESSLTHNRRYMKNNSKKTDAAQSSTLSKIKPSEGVEEEQETQDRQQDAGAKLIIQNGVNQPHNHQNQQYLTVNQAKVKQQLSPHHFKLLNVVSHRNKRQTPAVNSHNSNNNGNQQQQQQYSSFTIQYSPYQQQPAQQQQQTAAVQYQLQEQQPQQYQLQYYQPSQSQSQHQQNYNNIELIVNGNSLSTFPQSTAALAAATNIQQQQLPIATLTPKPVQGFPTLTTPLSTTSSTLPLTTENPFKPFLPLEIISDFNNDPTTPRPIFECQMCCVTNEFPCSKCCDGNPLLNVQTLKTLGG